MQDIIDLYNPANAANLSIEEIEAMQHLSDAEIAALSAAYPNQPTRNAYLRYYIKNEKPEQQRYPLGTWKNLHSLRKMGRSEIVPFGFVKSPYLPVAQKAAKVSGVPARVVDLGADEVFVGLKKSDTANENTEVHAEYIAALNLYNKAVEDKAHHTIVKKLKKQMDALKEAAGI